MKFTVNPQHTLNHSGIFVRLIDIYPHRREEIQAMVRKITEHGMVLTIEPRPEFHTNQQRRYYHMWKNRFADFTGNTPDEMHEALLCETYGSELVTTKMGEFIRPMARSHDQGKTEYSKLIDTLIRVAAQMGFHVPPPAPRPMMARGEAHEQSA